jgi:hypothetical protein
MALTEMAASSCTRWPLLCYLGTVSSACVGCVASQCRPPTRELPTASTRRGCTFQAFGILNTAHRSGLQRVQLRGTGTLGTRPLSYLSPSWANRVEPHHGDDVMFRPFDVYNQQCAGQLTIMVLMLCYSPLLRPASCTVERAAFRPCSICLTRPTPAACITATLQSASAAQL